MKQNIWCKFLNLHKYEILREESILNRHGNLIGTMFILKCNNCGKVKATPVYTEYEYGKG